MAHIPIEKPARKVVKLTMCEIFPQTYSLLCSVSEEYTDEEFGFLEVIPET